MKLMPGLVLFLTLLCISSAMAGRIMMLSVLGSKSTAHNMHFIGQELASRGHHITFVFLEGADIVSSPNISYIPQSIPNVNRDDYSAKFFKRNPLDVFPINWYFGVRMILNLCDVIYQTPELAALLNYKGKIDLVVFDGLLQDCYLPVIHSLGAPIVFYHGNTLEPTLSYYLNIPTPYSSVRLSFRLHKPLNFVERILNTMVLEVAKSIYTWTAYPRVDAIAKHVVPDSPGVLNIIKNASLFMGVADTVWSPARPLSPVGIDIACSHCRPAKQLSQEFQKVVDESGEHGFIVFTMGTYFDPKYFPPGYVKEFFTAFSQLKQTIIWKSVSMDASELPRNVKTFPWVPQQDLIGHPKARLCITHGGMYSMLEAVYHGIPILGIPIFGDQQDNLKVVEQRGSSMSINKFNISSNLLYEKITKLISDPSYKLNAMKMSARLQDQPETALERTIYWVEYVMRHNGASHLKGANADISLIEYYCLDIVCCCSIILTTPVLLILLGIKRLATRRG